jgi:hypothetical protein
MIFYDHSECEIEGTNREIRDLSDAIRALCEKGRSEDYVKIATHLLVQCSEGKVVIRCEPAQIVIKGDRAALTTLAQNLDWLAAQAPTGGLPSPHLHLEHVPNHVFLDPTSEPLLVSLKFTE